MPVDFNTKIPVIIGITNTLTNAGLGTGVIDLFENS